jgi:hypothetical protein
MVKSPGGRTAEDPDELIVEETTRSEVGSGCVVDDLCHPGTGDRQRGQYLPLHHHDVTIR